MGISFRWSWRASNRFSRATCLVLLVVVGGCNEQPGSEAKPQTPPPQPNTAEALGSLDKEVAGVYRYRAVPTENKHGQLADELDAVINNIRRFEFNAVLLKEPTGQDGNDNCTRVAVRCNPLGPVSNTSQQMPWGYNYTFIPNTNLVYGVDQGLFRVRTDTGDVERLQDATDYALRAPFDARRRELVLITRSALQTRFNVDTNEISKTEERRFPAVSYPMAYDAKTYRFLRLDPGVRRDGRPDIQLHEFDAERTLLSSRQIQSDVSISLDKQDGWKSVYDATVIDGYLILIVRRMPAYERNKGQNLCYVVDLEASKVIFSAEMVPQPSSGPPSPETIKGWSAEQVLTRASVDGRYSDLIKTIPAPDDAEIHTTVREFGEYVGTQWRGDDLPAGHYVYVYPNWYVWRTSNKKPTTAQQQNHVVAPTEPPGDPRLEKAHAAWQAGKKDAANEIWKSILDDPATPQAWYRASILMATHSAERERLAGAIERLEPLGRKVLGERTSVPYDVPSNQLAAEILNLLKSWHAELGQYRLAAKYAEAVSGSYFDTCGTYQAMYEASAKLKAKTFREWADNNEYHPSPRFTEMINGMTIADGGRAKASVLAQLSQVKRVVFGISKLNDGGARLLENLTQLEGVVSHNTQLTDVGLWSLSKLTKLEELVIPDAQITDKGSRYLSSLPELRILHLMYCPITDQSAETLGSLKNLTHLDIMHSKITDVGMAHLAGLTQLDHFGIPYQTVSGKSLVHLTGMDQLKSIYVGCPAITDQEMAPLSQLRALETLNLFTRSGAGEGMRHLSGLKNLKVLKLGDPTIKSHHLAPLRGTAIETLSLWGTTVDDDCIEIIREMTSLKKLSANGLRKLTPSGIRRLKGHPSLTDLALTSYCIPVDERIPLVEEMKPIKITYSAN